MNHLKRNALAADVRRASLALLLLGTAMPVLAQTSNPAEQAPIQTQAPAQDQVPRQHKEPSIEAETSVLSPVIVTASKKEDTNFSTTNSTTNSTSVISGETMETRQFDDLNDVLQRQGNVYFSDFTHNTTSFTIRGQGFSDDESDSTCNGVYLDGIAIYGLSLGQLFDLDQIELLRGPQSTLYGQSSTGGVVALHSRDPGFGFWRQCPP